MDITKTNLAMTVTCKCGGMVAATMLFGGVEIDAEFMDTVANIANVGGKIEIINTENNPATLSGCTCENIEP